MKQVININFQGRVVPIEVTAFDILKNYTESLNRHFANEVGKEEIINDIESRIGELFQEKLKNGATCITDDDVNAIIKSMGRPEEFEEDTATANAANAKQEQQQNAGAQQASYTNQSGTHKRLYRDEDNKILGGVCSGIANYFNVDAWVIRILFIVTGIGFFAYIILWAFLPTSANAVIGSTRKKLYRDGDDKLIAGVCSGIGNYFGISAWVPRVLFLLPFLSFVFRRGHWGFGDFPEFFQFGFSPGSVIIYIILWLVIPEAYTTAEKLEMKGEKIDLNSIKNSVKEEMKGVQQRAEKFGKEAKTFAEEKGKAMSSDINNLTKRHRSSLGDIISTMVKVFVYFVVGSVCIGLIIGLFALGIFAVGIFPLKSYILAGDAQNFYAWGTLLFFIGVPIIGTITLIVRRLAKIKRGSKMIRLSTICLWILGWFCFIMLLVSVSKDFRSSSRLEDQTVALSNPKVNKLIVTSTAPFTKKYYARNWLRLEPFENLIDEDTVYVRNIYVEIERSPNDSFQVTMKKMSRGHDRQDANSLASRIKFNVAQNDSILLLDKGIAINKTDKFRNQMVVITVYVPVGKQIRIDNGIGYGHVYFGSGNWANDWDNDYYDGDQEIKWQADVDYIMKADGLYTLTGRKADGWNDREERRRSNNKNRNNYRYNNIEDSLERRNDSIENRKQQRLDSIEKRQEHLKDSIDNQIEKEKNKIEQGNGFILKNDEEYFSSTVTPGVNILSGIL